ncbi:hypothetical protein [Bradyrhizobium sp. WSM1253]|uniref:hypothetical protein n=1 Tax=Bradyrhizobium sp. WSM1253 TaxID=319003 RepID=UPI00068694E7|nr:hypothetical protein [Bradyrhizobium sp. WSM1253]
MMRPLLLAAALAWTIAASGPAAARDGLATTMRAVLYEEDVSNPKGDRAEGKITWRIEPTTDASAPSGDVTIRGNVEVPSRNLQMTLSIRRNFDPALPATHTVQIDFAPDFAAGRIKQVMGLLMKANEQAKGAPIAALSVKVDDTHFLIGLSAVPQDAANNSLLIRSRAWMDIPIVYATQRRAILAVEKDGNVLALFNTVFAH